MCHKKEAKFHGVFHILCISESIALFTDSKDDCNPSLPCLTDCVPTAWTERAVQCASAASGRKHIHIGFTS